MAVLGFIVALVVQASVISNVYLKIDNSRVSDVRLSSATRAVTASSICSRPVV